ncbi:glycoside hydrolase family 3 protein [Piedraia hortae CBS 480.64]|uniref:beta-glucosidase n=1 Tax=Piedraia hortae CBS 480.64 TaxID=1314780 RepID=A0A6A7BT69_9PEZI|nr:glycoside hydrolase family 3 protein [Piedraia hortae CBS 480.64]
MGFLRASFLALLPLTAAQAPFSNSSGSSNSSGVDGARDWQTSPPSYPSPWGSGMGDWAASYAKARAFVSKLTLAEKVNLTTGTGWQSEKCVGTTGSIPRLGFNALCLQDSPLGLRFTDYNSAFPAGVTIASTWDRELIRQRGRGIGEEHKGKGVDVQLGPVVGPLGRAPEGGRNWEGFSPDPYLTGVAAAETIKGTQSAGVMCSLKHLIFNEQERFRNGAAPTLQTVSANVDDVTMHELYLWPFADAVRAGSASVMCSYQYINNSWGCQNSYTLNHLLKNELGFQGFVVSDWGAHHSGVSSTLAGLDMSMPGDTAFDTGDSFFGTNLTVAVLNGTVPQWRLDDMCVRIMAGYYYVGRDQNQVPDAPNFSSWTLDTEGFQHFYASQDYGVVNHHVDVRGNHGQQIRQQAAMGTVLLKNSGSLPLSGKEKLTAVFGSDAGGNPWGANGCADRGCDQGTLALGWGSGTADFPYLVTPLEAIKAQVVSQGGTVEGITDDYAYTQINALARRVPIVNGVCLAFVNSDAGEGYITVDGNEGDRNNLTLWHDGDTLIKNVTAQCNNTIVVIHSVGPVLVNSFYDNPNVTGIIWAGIPGQESGNAIVDILYGKQNPGGKSVFTWGASREDYGTDVLYDANYGPDREPQQSFTEGIFIDYRHFDKAGIDPIYEFGHGLSYTNFSYSNLQVTPHATRPYTAPRGKTSAAKTYGTISNRTSDYLYPSGINRVWAYIYPWLNSTDLAKSSGDPEYGTNYTFPDGSYDSSPQPYLRAGSSVSPGGNERLYDVMFTVSATIQNTGSRAGDEVVIIDHDLHGGNVQPPCREVSSYKHPRLPRAERSEVRGPLALREVRVQRCDLILQVTEGRVYDLSCQRAVREYYDGLGGEGDEVEVQVGFFVRHGDEDVPLLQTWGEG